MQERGDTLGIPGLGRARLESRGGFAAVYRATDETGNEVAVKVLDRRWQESSDALRVVFGREVDAVERLPPHPNLLPALGDGHLADGRPYLVMEYMTGGSLQDHLDRDGPLPWQDVLAVGVQLSGALETAHRHGVLHRDVKPANVLLDEDGVPHLADFGIARLDDMTLTHSLGARGSLPHIAPETLDGAEATPATDVYGLASTLHTLSAGEPPFGSGEDVAALIGRVFLEPPPSLVEHGVPDDVAQLLARSLAKTPEERPATAAAFGAELRGLQERHGLPSTPLDVRGPRRHRRLARPAAAAALIVVIVVIAFATTATALLTRRTSQPRPNTSRAATTGTPTSATTPQAAPADPLTRAVWEATGHLTTSSHVVGTTATAAVVLPPSGEFPAFLSRLDDLAGAGLHALGDAAIYSHGVNTVCLTFDAELNRFGYLTVCMPQPAAFTTDPTSVSVADVYRASAAGTPSWGTTYGQFSTDFADALRRQYPDLPPCGAACPDPLPAGLPW